MLPLFHRKETEIQSDCLAKSYRWKISELALEHSYSDSKFSYVRHTLAHKCPKGYRTFKNFYHMGLVKDILLCTVALGFFQALLANNTPVILSIFFR